jgi:hypothetical protein
MARAVYFTHFPPLRSMEPERINAIASTLTDLARRSAELRRYL